MNLYCRELTSYASNLVDCCHLHNEKHTQHILLTNVPVFGSQSPILTALETKNRKFSSLPACQKSVARVWTGKLDPQTAHWRVMLNRYF